MSRSKVIWEGSLGIDYSVEQGHLVKRTFQPDHKLVLEANAEERKLPKQRFLGGHKVGSIPINDIPYVKSKYPEFWAKCDQETKKKALIRFSNDPDMEQYRIARA